MSVSESNAAINPGEVVWIKLAGYPWWPCKVELGGLDPGKLAFRSFEDDILYQEDEFGKGKVKVYNCKDLPDMLRKGRHSLRNKPSSLEQYGRALSRAEVFIKTFCPEFSLSSPCPSQAVMDKESATETETEDTVPTACGDTPEGSKSTSEGKIKTKRKRERNGNRTEMNENGVSDDGCMDKKAKLLSCEGLEKATGSGTVTTGVECQVNLCPVDPLVSSTPLTKVIKSVASETGEGESETAIVPNREEGCIKTEACLSFDCEVRGEDTSTGKGEELANDRMETAAPCNGSEAETRTPPRSSMSPIQATPTSRTRESYYQWSSSDSELDLNSDSDDSLPPLIDMSSSETVQIHELEKGDVIWVKYRNDPHWPALVSNVTASRKKVSKATATVYFFGQNEYNKSSNSFKINKNTSIAPFTAKQSEKFSKLVGDDDKNNQLQLALSEAERYSRARASEKGKYATDNAVAIMLDIVGQRLPDYESRSRLRDNDWTPPREEQASSHPNSDTEYTRPASSSESEGEREMEESGGEEDIPPYTYDRVAREIESLEPILLGIIAGEVESSHHRVYMDGARKERNQLKVGNKLGPISKWSSSKVEELVSKVLVPIAKKHQKEKRWFGYAFDVLLPEAMVRVKAVVENITMEQAVKEF